MATSLILNYNDLGGKKLQKTITNVNPAATSQQLTTFTQGLNGLTNNTYVETNRVDKFNCDNDTGKTIPTLTLGASSGAKADIAAAEGGYNTTVTYNGSGTLTVAASVAGIVANVAGGKLYIGFVGEAVAGTVTVYAAEDDTYAAGTAVFTITD